MVNKKRQARRVRLSKGLPAKCRSKKTEPTNKRNKVRSWKKVSNRINQGRVE